jgi:hypothetical protein
MCETCDQYADSIPTTTPEQLDALLARIGAAVKAGELEAMDEDRALRTRQAGAPLPRERPVIARWICAMCSRVFMLELNTCRLAGDGWRPLFGN